MKKIPLFLKRNKFTFSFILLSFALPSAIMTIINRDIQIPRDIIIAVFANLLLLLILGRKIELKGTRKNITVMVTVSISVLSPLILMMLFIFSPSQKEHDRIMYEICLPELRKYYNVKEGQSFPPGPVDKHGNGKWWFQHLECENNVLEDKGPIFSDNPPAFQPVK